MQSTDIKTENKSTEEKPKEKLEDVMKDLEQKVNPKTLTEGIAKCLTATVTKNDSIILGPMQQGAKEFEERVGRPMSYSEMRSMWG